ncbi:MAG: hypothetical protein NUV46_01930 [Nanoarchaeota archaeon]|nr:hypothetical protein [Nanoarchaeota archaeon]
MNKIVVFNSLIALTFVYLAFRIDWLFLIGAVVLMIVNQRILLKK